MSGWVWLYNPAIKGFHRVPDNPAVIAMHVGRGWEVVDIPGEFNSDDEEFAAAWTQLQKATVKAQPANKKKEVE